MITNLLIEHRYAATALLLAAAVVGLVLGVALASRPRAAGALAAVAALGVLGLTFMPAASTVDDVRCTVQWAMPTFGRVELLANVALFVAPVLLAGVATRRPLAAFAAGSLGSALIELVQALLPQIGRACDTTDWWCNTLGAALGATLAAVALTIHRRTAAASPPGRSVQHATR